MPVAMVLSRGAGMRPAAAYFEPFMPTYPHPQMGLATGPPPRAVLHHSLVRQRPPQPLLSGEQFLTGFNGWPAGPAVMGPPTGGPPGSSQHQQASFIQYRPPKPEYGPYSDGEADKVSRKMTNKYKRNNSETPTARHPGKRRSEYIFEHPFLFLTKIKVLAGIR